MTQQEIKKVVNLNQETTLVTSLQNENVNLVFVSDCQTIFTGEAGNVSAQMALTMFKIPEFNSIIYDAVKIHLNISIDKHLQSLINEATLNDQIVVTRPNSDNN